MPSCASAHRSTRPKTSFAASAPITVSLTARRRDTTPLTATPGRWLSAVQATDVNRCSLKPLRREDYYPTDLTKAEWGELQQTFPTGVCDWSKPGVDQQNTIPWLTYQDA